MIKQSSIRFREEILRFCERLSKLYVDPTVILCGSTARGEDMPWSDVDLLVIAEFKQPFMERLEELSTLNDTRAPLEVVGYTVDEAMMMLGRLDAKFIEAMEYGIPVLKGSSLHKLVGKFGQLKDKGLTRTDCSYLLSSE